MSARQWRDDNVVTPGLQNIQAGEDIQAGPSLSRPAVHSPHHQTVTQGARPHAHAHPHSRPHLRQPLLLHRRE